MKIGNSLNARPGKPDCANCPLSKHEGRGFKESQYVAATITPYAPILFVGMAPGKEEVIDQEVFVGPAGRILNLGLEAQGIDRSSEASLINLLACKVPNSPGKPNDWALAGQAAVKACAPRFVKDFNQAQPKLIVTLGAEALHAVDPTATGRISKLRGYVREFEHEGKKYDLLPTYHPSYLLYDPSPAIVSLFNRDLAIAKEHVNGGHPKQTRQKVQRRTTPRLPRADQSTAGVGVLEVPLEWSIGSLQLQAATQVVDVEASILAKEHSKTALLCVGVAPDPRTSTGRKKDQQPRPRVRVVPDEKLPHRLGRLSCLIGHNSPHDYCALRQHGLLRERDEVTLECTMMLGSLIDENREQGLKTYAEENGYPRYWEEVEKYWKAKQNPPREVLYKYNAYDVALTSDLYVKFKDELDQHPQMKQHYEDFLRPSLRLAAELHLNGIQTLPTLAKEVPLLRRRIWRKAHKLFDVAEVPKEKRTLSLLRKKDWLQSFLFGPFGLRLTPSKRHRTKVKRDPQLNRAHYEYLKEKDATGAVQLLFDLSFEQKQLTDLVQIQEYAGQLIFPRYNLGGTGEQDDEGRPVRTGRWSAQDPNIQQFANYIKRHMGSRYEGGYLFQWDGSQIEVRVAAQHSEDPHLMRVFEEGLDCYIDASTTIFGASKAKERRFMGKRSLLAAIYGVGKRKLRRELNLDLIKLGFKERVTDDDCAGFLDALFQKISRHREWINDTRDFARTHGYVDSLIGRRRRIPLAMSNDAHALNQAINFPIQYFAHCVNTLSALKFGWKFSHGVLCAMVHDSGVGDARSLDGVVAAEKRIQKIWRDMPKHVKDTFGVSLRVPMGIEFKAGRTWHPLGSVEKLLEAA